MRERPTALFLMLPVFLIVAIGAVIHEVRSERPHYHEGARGATPYGPNDFPEVFAFDPLEGLQNATGVVLGKPPEHLRNPEYWPCSDCHDEPVKGADEPRKLEDEHAEIVIAHGPPERWCLDCHDFEDRDMLRLVGGQKIPFERSDRLCGQCHGPTYRDWNAGIHGKQTGFWNGAKLRFLCVSCHRPHSPHFPSMKPLPVPVRPQYIRLGGTADGGDAGGEKKGAAEGDPERP